MPRHRLDLRQNSLIGAALFIGLSLPVLAHEVEVAGEVAATFHIEPHHNPRAGQPSQAWFALTRKGGTVIPLQQCNCQLKVYASSHKPSGKPILEPTLKPMNVEQYKGIPGAEIVFPKAGLYTLIFSGTAKKQGNFQPFKLDYKVTVGG